MGSTLRLQTVASLAFVACVSVGCEQQPASSPVQVPRVQEPAQKTWEERRSETQLVLKTPRIQHGFTVDARPPDGFQTIHYTSLDSDGSELRLFAWLALPARHPSKDSSAENVTHQDAVPAVVYFHSGHELGPTDCDTPQLFLNAGFAVLLPTLRGENGNAGSFEMFWGEVDDGLAAVNWLAAQPEIDGDRIYTFGHSAGGGVSALLSLADPDAPIRFGGSCGGIYAAANLRGWQPEPPFEASGNLEFDLRALLPNVRLMQRKHYAYLGLADVLCENVQFAGSTQLTRHYVLGDHLSSLPIAATDFARRIFRDAFSDANPLPDFLRPLPWNHLTDVPTESVVPDHELPTVWNVKPDPTSCSLEFYRGDVQCDILMRSEKGYFGDFVFPRGFGSVAKYHAMQGAPKPGTTFIDLSVMLHQSSPADVVFPILHKNSYCYDTEKGDRFSFRWPGTNRPVHSEGMPDTTIPWAVYAASPGGRYVAGFSDTYELIVWDAKTETIVGRNPLPELKPRDGQPAGSIGRLQPAEAGFSPDGQEFAAVVGEIGNMYLVNYHWESGAITAFYPTVTPWSGHRSVRYPNRYRLQFLEDGHGWLVEFGKTMIDRQTGKRRRPFAFQPLDPRFYRMDTATFTVPRLISGNRALVVMQNPVDLFHQQIQTVALDLPNVEDRRRDNGEVRLP